MAQLPRAGAGGDDSRVEQSAPIAWRADAAHWRWLLLGTLGLTATACGGRSGGAEPDGGDAVGARGPSVGSSGGGSTIGGSTSSGGRPVSGGSTQPGGSGEVAPTRPPDSQLCSTPLTDLGGNWERCANGIVHRRELGVCPSSLPRTPELSGLPFTPDDDLPPDAVDAGSPPDGDVDPPTEDGCGFEGCCSRDSDCTAAPHGYCAPGDGFDSLPAPYCHYGCVDDSECDAGQVCLCGDLIGICVSARCSVDADCGGSLACTPYTRSPGCPGIEFACQTATDRCVSDADCEGGAQCSLQSEASGRSCQPQTCDVGRPFLVNGQPRLAAASERADWYAESAASRALGRTPLEPDVELRAAARQGWLDQALMEHASVAAFARFSLELLSLGAPAELVRDAATAMADEVRHARECFSLARRYSENDVGPGPLLLTGALESRDLGSIVVAAIEEGCIGETIAALEAAETLAHCVEPEARRVLEQISRDETEHARLAWRFVAWALAAAPDVVREAARQAFWGELERDAPLEPESSAGLERELLRRGLMSGATRARLRSRVAREVVAPCAEALFRSLDGGASPDEITPLSPGQGLVC